MMRILKMIIAATLLVAAASAPVKLGVQAEVNPIADTNANCLLGGTVNGKWQKANAIARLMKGGEKYRFYTLTALAGEGRGAKPTLIGPPCEETLQVDLTPLPADSKVIAVGGQWNALPRAPRLLSTNERTYQEAVSEILKRNGITNPKVNITQLIRLDLEGDGVDEVVISATRYDGGLTANSKAGDYSLVLLRKLIGGRVENIMLSGDFYPRPKTFNAPSEYKVSAIADLNGDGVMEVVVFGQYYEGQWSTVYSVNNGKAQKVLSCACGA